mmetsp:Transcript_44513/g.72422  ORF Transcript_44513/g.72422 Transcript_44513/m.72422 type:complete len:248 (+) Transcript_44513:219-962(+)
MASPQPHLLFASKCAPRPPVIECSTRHRQVLVTVVFFPLPDADRPKLDFAMLLARGLLKHIINRHALRSTERSRPLSPLHTHALHTSSEALVGLCCSGSKAKQSMNIELSKSGLRSGSTLLHSEPDIMALQTQTGSPDGADTQPWPPSHSGETAFADTNARPQDPVGSQSFALTPVTRKRSHTHTRTRHALASAPSRPRAPAGSGAHQQSNPTQHPCLTCGTWRRRLHCRLWPLAHEAVSNAVDMRR